MYCLNLIIILVAFIRCTLCNTDPPCKYKKSEAGKVADCSGRELQDVPRFIHNDTVILDLHNNNITSLHNESFENLHLLKRLDLCNNNIKTIDMCSFCNLTKLTYLNMSHNQPGGLNLIRNMTYGLQFTNVTDLNFTNMEDPTGPGKMIYKEQLEYFNKTSIKRLNFSGNMWETIERGSIIYFPSDLEILDVSDNRPVLAPYLIEIKELKQLRVIYANRLNAYQSFNLFGMLTSTGESFYSTNHSQTSSNFELCIDLPPSLEEIYCRDSMIPFDVPYIPVCPDNSLRLIELNHNAIGQWLGPVQGFNKLEHIDLSLNLCDNISDNFFASLTSLKTLILKANFIGYVIEDRLEETKGTKEHPCPWLNPLTNLVKLDLHLNKIRKLPRECFSTLKNLQELNLRENSISDWELRIDHMPNLSFIDLSGNYIDRFPDDTMRHLSEISKNHNVTINLSENEIECFCKNIDFLEWFDTVNIKFVNKERYTCRNEQWETVNMSDIKKILDTLQTRCHMTDYTYLNTVLSIAIGCFTLVVLYGIFNRYKWKLSYIYYMTWGRYNLLQDDNAEFCYDAYISYSEEDNHLAEEFAANLQSLSLYLFERDCKPGKSIQAVIVDKIEKSRKVIVLFTRSYAKNWRCFFELRMATMRRMCRTAGPDSVYLINIDSMPHQDIPLEILELFQSELYIEYPNNPRNNTVFWEKMKNTIKPTMQSFV